MQIVSEVGQDRVKTRKPNNNIDPGHVCDLKALAQDDLLLHVEAILVKKGGDPLTDNERNDRLHRRRNRIRHAVPEVTS